MQNGRRIGLSVLAAAFTLVALWQTDRTVTPKETTLQEVFAKARKGGYQLISTNQLWKKSREDADRLLIVDTRQDWEYRAGHIQGALNFPMEPTWLARWQKKGQLEALLGPEKKRPIVFY